MFTIAYTTAAAKQMRKLPKADARRLAAKIEAFAADPFAPHGFAKPLIGRSEVRVRAGNYRAIVEVQKDRFIVLVVEVGDRKNVYD